MVTRLRRRRDAALIDAMRDLQAAVEAQTEFAKSLAATDNIQLTKTLTDLISGKIVGKGIAGRGFEPGTGIDYSY